MVTNIPLFGEKFTIWIVILNQFGSDLMSNEILKVRKLCFWGEASNLWYLNMYQSCTKSDNTNPIKNSFSIRNILLTICSEPEYFLLKKTNLIEWSKVIGTQHFF